MHCGHEPRMSRMDVDEGTCSMCDHPSDQRLILSALYALRSPWARGHGSREVIAVFHGERVVKMADLVDDAVLEQDLDNIETETR